MISIQNFFVFLTNFITMSPAISQADDGKMPWKAMQNIVLCLRAMKWAQFYVQLYYLYNVYTKVEAIAFKFGRNSEGFCIHVVVENAGWTENGSAYWEYEKNFHRKWKTHTHPMLYIERA